jgi:hypothetical protein
MAFCDADKVRFLFFALFSCFPIYSNCHKRTTSINHKTTSNIYHGGTASTISSPQEQP